jgi:hypothetical protein
MLREQLAQMVRLLYRKDDIIEIRALKPPGRPFIGRYPYGSKLISVLENMDTECDYDLYVCLNPTTLPPINMQQYVRGTTKEDVAFRRWFLLDVDPVRKQEGRKIATEEEWRSAADVMRRAKGWLETDWGWDGILTASSGNGCHLLVPCDLPNDKPSEYLVKCVQRAVADRFSTDDAIIECFPDSDRITRAYGSLNRKGCETETLKHRRSGMLML